MYDLNELLRQAEREMKASDLHLTSGRASQPKCRVDGVLGGTAIVA